MRFLISLFAICMIVISTNTLAANSPPATTYEIDSSCTYGQTGASKYGYDCFLNFQRFLKSKDGSWILPTLAKPWACRAINPLDLNYTNVFLIPGEKTAKGHMFQWLEIGVGIGAGSMAVSAYALGPLGFLAASAFTYIAYNNICNYSFVFAPQEYYAWKIADKHPLDTSVKPFKYSINTPNITSLPNYFHCNPYSNLSNLQSANMSAQTGGSVWGYPAVSSSLCSQGVSSNFQMPEMVNKIAVGIQTPSQNDAAVAGLFGASYSFSNFSWLKGRTEVLEISPYDEPVWSDRSNAAYVAYYRDDGGNKLMCAGIVSFMIPVEVGCTSTSVPKDDSPLPTPMQNFVKGTRCLYLHEMRSDLQNLGNSGILLSSTTQGNTDSNNYSGLPIAKFLKSEIHFTSNVVGCIKDILIKKFVNDPQNPSSKNYFILLKEQISPILYAVFLLFVSLLGIKIISSAQPISKGQALLYILKLAIVMYLTIGDGWYSQNPDRPGLFKPIIYASDQIADLFMQAFNNNDPAGLCRFKYGNRNILSEQEINISSTSQLAVSNTSTALNNTEGFPNVIKLSVWDLLDCHIANYMTYGSCNYTMGGLISIWLITLGFFTFGAGAIVAIISFLYLLMLFLVVFRFTHTYIICMLSIAILALLSPIFLCFFLFDSTKEYFRPWARMILGNMLYPALLFAFLSLMFTAFNAVYYGDLNINKSNPQDFIAACKDPNGNPVQSIFCETTRLYSDTSKICSTDWMGSVKKNYLQKIDLGPFGNFHMLNTDIIQTLLVHLLKILVIMIIFYHFSNQVLNLFSTLVSMQRLATYTRGRVNMLDVAKSSLKVPYSGAKSILKGFARRVR